MALEIEFAAKRVAQLSYTFAMQRLVWTVLLCSVAWAQQAGPPTSGKLEIRGAYSHPSAFWKTGAKLDESGINAVFVHSGSINQELAARVRQEGARLFAEFATLNGKGYVESHPEAWPVNEKGEKAAAATWFLGACPTEPGFRAWRMKQLEELLDRQKVDGIWMDYLHWHAQFEDPHPVLPETCFSPTCLRQFSQATGIRLPAVSLPDQARWILSRHEPRWRAWRCSVIADWIRAVRAVMVRKQPDLLLGAYLCPWDDRDYDGARQRILGLDLKLLAPLVDVMSPMVYHARMGRPPEWVGQSVEWLSRTIAGPHAPRIWPIVQAHGDPREISADEFRRVLELGRGGGASGVMMFTIGSVAQDPAKMSVLKDLYRAWSRD